MAQLVTARICLLPWIHNLTLINLLEPLFLKLSVYNTSFKTIIVIRPELFKLSHTFLILLFFIAYWTRNFLEHTVLIKHVKE
jgi:hypothetical protein